MWLKVPWAISAQRYREKPPKVSNEPGLLTWHAILVVAAGPCQSGAFAAEAPSTSERFCCLGAATRVTCQGLELRPNLNLNHFKSF